MKIRNIFSLLAVLPLPLLAQFAPEAGMPGSTAMHCDSSAFVAWATGCEVERGLQKIDDVNVGLASYGADMDGIGKADNRVVSLGDGGVATLSFSSSIKNAEGPDFAVFENGFHSEPHVFLELAFVEVSSDGEHFFRFPAISNVSPDSQMGSFETMDASLIHNFAGKYEAFYGTPFDLDDLDDDPLLNKNEISYVRLVDVIGNVDPQYASYDSEGHPVNDPWPTPFYSSGFDLDAVGVIHDSAHDNSVYETLDNIVKTFPNPTNGLLTVVAPNGGECDVYDVLGQKICSPTLHIGENSIVDLSNRIAGIYLVHIISNGFEHIEKIVKY